MALCHKTKLTIADLEIMDIGMCLDYIDEYIDLITPENEKTREATQKDFDNF